MLKYLKVVGITLTSLVFILSGSEAFAGSEEGNLLSKTFDAHGGLDKWQEKKTLIYTLKGFPVTPQVAKPNTATVDLVHRFNRIEGEGFVVGFDGENDWVSPNIEAVGIPPRFFSMATFYYVGMPFVFGDEGVVLSDGGTGTFNGKEYKLIRVSYKTGTGYTSKDEYELFIDKQTDRLALLNNTVAEIPSVDRVTWVFSQWQTVDGLVVPSKLIFYPDWNPDNPGDGAEVLVQNVSFSEQAPNPEIYAPPANAEVVGAPQVH